VQLPIRLSAGRFGALELATSGGGERDLLGLRLHNPRVELVGPGRLNQSAISRPDLSGMNLAVVLMDAGAAGHYSLYGYRRPTSPRLEKLARESVVFEHAYAEAPYTRAATASLFTGLYPETHGAVLPLSKLPAWAGSMPVLFKSAGFSTAGFIANGNVATQFGFARGFDSYTEVMRLSGYDSYARSFWPVLDPWLDHHQARRFFLYLHFREPHAYYLAPEGWLGRFSSDCPDCLPGHEPVLDAINRHKLDFSERDIRHIEAQYDELIAWIDHSIGEFIERLKARRLWDQTVLVVLSDHGEAFMEHGLMMHNYTVYGEMLRTVLLVRFPPGTGVRPRRVSTRVGLIDMLPSLLDLFGQPVPEGLAGQSVAPLILTGDGAQRPRDVEVARTSRQPPIYGVFDDRFKYIVNAITGVEELYDLVADPAERRSLAAERPLAIGFYRQELKRWYLQQVDSRGSWESARAGEIDANLRANLQALGYVGTGTAPIRPKRQK
jgi:arylsulfatase A-like enzyme